MDTKLPKSKLTDQWCIAGRNPELMGTTGLVAWVLHDLPSRKAPRTRWERYQAALRVIRSRNLSCSLFTDAILSTGYRYGINLKRFFNASRKVKGVGKSVLKPEFVTWP